MSRLKKPLTESTPVGELMNISKLTATWLEDNGINNYGDLRRSNLIEVWKELKKQHKQVTMLMYYALWGAAYDNTHIGIK